MVTVEEVWERSGLLLKVKETTEQEYARLRDDLILFGFLHIATYASLASSLVDGGITAIAWCPCTRRSRNATLPSVHRSDGRPWFRRGGARDPALARGVNVRSGRITHLAVAEAHGQLRA